MSNWNRWKLKRTCGTPTKNYIGDNGLLLKSGRILKLNGEKYQFVLLDNGAVGVVYGYGDFSFGLNLEIINHQGWEVVFNKES